MPRSRVVIAGVSMSHMSVSLMTATSAAQRVAMRGEDRLEVGAADLFLALDQHRDPHRQAPVVGVPGAQRFQPQHGLALVVDGAAGDDARAVRTVDQRGSKGGLVQSSSGSAGCTS